MPQVAVAALALLAVWAQVLAPARAGLQPVPLPRVEPLEIAVADHLREAAAAVEQARGSSGSRSELVAAYGALGRILHAYEFFEGAAAAYRNAVQLAPADPLWRHLLGALFEQTGRLEEAGQQFSSILRDRPGHREAAVHLAEVYVRLNRLREARELFQEIAGVYPVVAENGLGEIALREGRYQDAARHFEDVLRRVPQAAAVHYSLAMAYRGLGRIDEARAHLARQGRGGVRAADAVVEALPGLVRGERALVLQGRRAYEAGQLDEAADAFRRAVAAAPGSATARGNLGLVLRQQGRDADAVPHLRAAFDLAPGDTAIRRALVGALVRLHHDDEAIAVLGRGTVIAPDDEDGVVGLAILLADRQRYAEAVAVLSDAYERFPDRTATATTLARLLASAPDRSLRNGQRSLDLALSVHEASPMPAHAETVALALAELGRCEEAAAWMRRAVTEAERRQDATEVERLSGETPKYRAGSCRP